MPSNNTFCKMNDVLDIIEPIVAEKTANERIDAVELALTEFEPVECPLTHVFTPGIYTRQIFMPAGSLITSKIHKTRHPFFVLQGKVSVYTEKDGEIIIEAPYSGITEPGTRRVLFIWEDCIWTTVHANPDNETVEQIEDRIIEKYDNPLLSEEQKLVFKNAARAKQIVYESKNN